MLNKMVLSYHLSEEVREDEHGEYRFLVPCLMIDDTQFNKDHHLDLEELVKSTQMDGEFDILTCGCGEPGCAGIFEGVTVTHKANQVFWKVPNPISYPPEGGGTHVEYTFDRFEYMAAIKAGLDEAKEIIKGSTDRVSVGIYGAKIEDVLSLEVRRLFLV